MKIGLEMTYVPDKRRDKEFTSLHEAQRATTALNRLLKPINRSLEDHNTMFFAKVDPFRRDDDGNFNRWIIEVVNGAFPTHGYSWHEPQFIKLVQRVYDAAKSLRLLPRIRRRGVHHPSGGCHKHVGLAGLFSDNTQFLTNLAFFEKALFTDYANRPYIRWLFSEWFDESHNSDIAVKEEDLKGFDPKNAYQYARDYSTGIKARYSCDAKPSYSTYEFRFFDSVDNAKDLSRNVLFLLAWVRSIRAKVEAGMSVKFTLNRSLFKKLRDEEKAWEVISGFLHELRLDPKNYRRAFEENYLLRLRHGKMT